MSTCGGYGKNMVKTCTCWLSLVLVCCGPVAAEDDLDHGERPEPACKSACELYGGCGINNWCDCPKNPTVEDYCSVTFEDGSAGMDMAAPDCCGPRNEQDCWESELCRTAGQCTFWEQGWEQNLCVDEPWR